MRTKIFFLILFLFSFLLMFHTFGYNRAKGTILMGRTVWSDFAAHIPLIRSFSMGDNLERLLSAKPPEYPLFPGEPIRYHFLFYLFVGLLEKSGVRLDWALNIPSSLGFFLLLVMIYFLSKELFSDRRVGILAVLFFLFNGSLAFVDFFKTHPISSHTLLDILHANSFPAFAPWGKGDITAFWNLNIYTNQRHLAPAFGIILLFMYMCHKFLRGPLMKSAVFFGLLFGLFPIFHQPSLLIVGIITSLYFILFPKLRVSLVLTAIIAGIIALLTKNFIAPSTNAFAFQPGFLMEKPITIIRFIEYWWHNIGLHMFLIPLGFLLAPTRAKKALLPIIPLFIFPNLYKFSIEIAASHKFFNFALILGNMFSAYVLVKLYIFFKRFHNALNCLTVLLILFLTLSGLIDFFVIFNDTKGELSDIPANPGATWIAQHTPKDAIFLNSSFLYHPASLAGRKVFLGWPYFSWSAGYDTNTRLKEMKIMYESNDPTVVCRLFTTYHISYVSIDRPSVIQEVNFPSSQTPSVLTLVYETPNKSFQIYRPGPLCR